MRDIKEYIIEAAKSDVVMSPAVLKEFLFGGHYRFNDVELMDMLDSLYKEYAYAMVNNCRYGAATTSFDLRIVYSSKEGIIFKGVNKKTIKEFLWQFDRIIDMLSFDPKFSHWNAKNNENGLMLMFRNNPLSSEVKSFCDKNNL